MRFIFAATFDAEVISEKLEAIERKPSRDTFPPCSPPGPRRALSAPSVSACFGLPCAMKVMGYFVNVVHKYTNESEQHSDPPSPLERSPSVSPGAASEDSGGAGAAQDVQELVVALKTLQAIVWSDGDTGNCRGIVLRFVMVILAALGAIELTNCPSALGFYVIGVHPWPLWSEMI